MRKKEMLKRSLMVTVIAVTDENGYSKKYSSNIPVNLAF